MGGAEFAKGVRKGIGGGTGGIDRLDDPLTAVPNGPTSHAVGL